MNTEHKPGTVGCCETCRAPIIWLTSPKTYKTAPIDIAPVLNGNLKIDLEYGVYLHIIDRGEVSENERYVSHFATCPNAQEFRHA